MPLLMCMQDAPFFRPMRISGNLEKDRTGGWTVIEFTLQNFYKEHNIYRNTWSLSNCQFDLAQYRGTYMTLYPTTWQDYIVWWDTDYGNFNEFADAVKVIHPAVLINKPHTKVVLSRQTLGRYRPRKIFLPPPSVFTNKWDPISVWAERGLAIMAISTIDFTYPWLHTGFEIRQLETQTHGWKPTYNMYDYYPDSNKIIPQFGPDAPTKKITLDEVWWNYKDKDNAAGTVWLAKWPDWKTELRSDTYSEGQYASVALGPFVTKNQRADCQIIGTYRSRWRWGGDVLTREEQICDPSTNRPKSLQFQEPVEPKYCITRKDIDKAGFIKPDAWRRLTEEDTEAGGLTNFIGKIQNEEEESDHTIQGEPEEEEEDPGPKRRRLSGGKLDGGRIEQLFRLRYLLDQIADQRRRSY